MTTTSTGDRAGRHRARFDAAAAHQRDRRRQRHASTSRSTSRSTRRYRCSRRWSRLRRARFVADHGDARQWAAAFDAAKQRPIRRASRIRRASDSLTARDTSRRAPPASGCSGPARAAANRRPGARPAPPPPKPKAPPPDRAIVVTLSPDARRCCRGRSYRITTRGIPQPARTRERADAAVQATVPQPPPNDSTRREARSHARTRTRARLQRSRPPPPPARPINERRTPSVCRASPRCSRARECRRLLEHAPRGGRRRRHSANDRSARSAPSEAPADANRLDRRGGERRRRMRRGRSLRRVINATGVVLHTNLGRAPLAPAARGRHRCAWRGDSRISNTT